MTLVANQGKQRIMNTFYIKSPINFFQVGVDGDTRCRILTGDRFFGSPNQSAEHAYLYGSRLRFVGPTDVVLENPFIPTGAVLYRWDAIYSYNAAKAAPQLPLLAHEHHYQLHLDAEFNAPLYLRVLMFDYQGELVDQAIIKEKVGVFTFHPDAYTYSVELVSAGCTSLTFHQLDITDVTAVAAPLLKEYPRGRDVVADPHVRADLNYGSQREQNKVQTARRLAVVNQFLN